jgi:hypothetical protein
VHGAVEDDLLSGERAGVEALHGAASAVEQVAMPAVAAEGLGVGVDLIEPGRGQRPGGVLAAPDEDVARERRRHRADLVDAGALEVHLEREPGIEVADLRAGDHDRVVGGRAPPGHEQRVAGVGAGLSGRGNRGRGRASDVAGVERDVPAHAPRSRLELDVTRHARRRLGVERLAQILPGRQSAPRTEALLEGREQWGVEELVAPALADELVLEGVEGVDVVAREGVHVREDAEPVGVRADVGVDALEEDVDVVEHGPPLGSVCEKRARLLGQVGLGLAAGGEVLQARHEAEGVQPGGVDGGDP